MHVYRYPAGGVKHLSAIAVLMSLCALSAQGQTLIERFNGAARLDAAGYAVAGGGDVDGDGVADVLVGLAKSTTTYMGAGKARVYSGATGQLIREFSNSQPQPYARFGAAVAILDDLDGDGHCEVLIGAPWYDYGGLDCGAAFLYSGSSGAIMQTFGGS